MKGIHRRWRTVKEERAAFWALLLLALIPLFPEYVAPVLAMVSLAFASRDAHRRQDHIRTGGMGKLLIVYMGYSLLGTLYSSHPGNSAASAAMWIVMFCGYLTVVTVVHNRRRLETALLLFTLSTGLVGAIAGGQYVLRDLLHLDLPNQIWLELDRLFYRNFPLVVDLSMADYRAAGTFNNPNVLGEFLIIMLPSVIYYSFGGKRTKLQLMGRICLLAVLLGVAVTFSRGAYLALLSMLMLILVTNLRRITPLILSLFAAVSLIPESVIARFLAIGDSTDQSISIRFAAWDVAIQAIIEHPILGLGPGVSNLWELLKNMGIHAPHSHNLLLQLLVEGGFIALFLFAMLAIRLLQGSIELMGHSPKTNFLGATFTMFVVSFMVYGMVDYPFLSPKLVGAFLLVIGLAEACFSLYLAQETSPLRRAFRIPLPKRKKKKERIG